MVLANDMVAVAGGGAARRARVRTTDVGPEGEAPDGGPADAVADEPADAPVRPFGLEPDERGIDVAVLIPCRNEAATVADVVRDFRAAIPTATIFVYDNNSTDRTAELAAEAGAVVRHVSTPGKGNVVRRMFGEVDATYYVIVDGDDTYDAASAPTMLRRLHQHQIDMVVGRRVESASSGDAYRRGHRLGNRVLTGSVRSLFGTGPTDMLSGYRALSRRYVKSFPATSAGFETETEMTVHALDINLSFDEVATPYRERPDESTSKLRTIPDGYRILKLILLLCKDYRPLLFFGTLGMIVAVLAAALAVFPWGQAVITPTQDWLCVAAAVVLLGSGIVLGSLRRSRQELKRMIYLSIAPQSLAAPTSEPSKPPASAPASPTIDLRSLEDPDFAVRAV